METELSKLIIRTEMAARRAENDGFYKTAEALRSLASGLLDDKAVAKSANVL